MLGSVVQEMLRSPNRCMACHAVNGAALDLGFDFQSSQVERGRAYLCVDCCRQVGGVLGMVDEGWAGQIQAKLLETERRLEVAEAELDSVRSGWVGSDGRVSVGELVEFVRSTSSSVSSIIKPVVRKQPPRAKYQELKESPGAVRDP